MHFRIFVIYALILGVNSSGRQQRFKPKGLSEAVYKKLGKPIIESVSGKGWKELVSSHPETTMTTVELIRHAGMEAETHQLTTKDGYILQMHRIPSKKGPDGRSAAIPVLLLNVLICCTSSGWVFNLRNQSLGFVLADAGYDVWLGNYRGGRFSRNHLVYSNTSRQFWDHSFDELAKWDVPEMVDYIIEATGHKKIFMGGGIFGTTPVILSVAKYGNLNEKLRGLILLSPAPELYDKKMAKGAQGVGKGLSFLSDWIGQNMIVYLFKTNWLFNLFGPLVGNTVGTAFMQSLASFNEGVEPNRNSYNATRLPVYAGHAPNAFSLLLLSHLFQIMGAGKVREYDWGSKEKNMAHLGHEVPEFYDLTKITVPALITHNKHGVLAGYEEALRLSKQIKDSELYEVPDESWPHFGYIIFTNTGPVFRRVIEFMRKH